MEDIAASLGRVYEKTAAMSIMDNHFERTEIMDAEDSTGGGGGADDQDTSIASIQEICVAAVKSAQAEESAWRTIVEEVKRITQANRSRLLAAKSAEVIRLDTLDSVFKSSS